MTRSPCCSWDLITQDRQRQSRTCLGDRLIVAVAERLRHSLGEEPHGPSIARLGGDEFTLLMPHARQTGGPRSTCRTPVGRVGCAVPRRRSRAVCLGQHRHRAEHGRAERCRRLAARGGRGDVSGQEQRPRARASSMTGPWAATRRIARAGNRATSGDRTQRPDRLLPAHRRPRDRPCSRAGSARALGPPPARVHVAGGVHSAGRRDWPDRAAWPLGARGGVSPGPPVAGRASERSAADGQRQSVGAPVAAARSGVVGG